MPIGEDQIQHLELCKFLAERLQQSRDLRDFPIPQPLITAKEQGGRIMSLKNPSKKMSKSDPDDSSRINMDDDHDAIYAKIRGALTESNPCFDIPLEEMSPAMSNLATIYGLLNDGSGPDISKFESIQQFKKSLTDSIIRTLQPIKAKIELLCKEPEVVEGLLLSGEARARERAQETIKLINI